MYRKCLFDWMPAFAGMTVSYLTIFLAFVIFVFSPVEAAFAAPKKNVASKAVNKTPTLSKQRTDFKEAVKAFKKGDKAKFFRLEKNLKNYILYPYLRYLVLNQNLAQASQTDIQKFINTYPDSHMAEKLELHWLHRLAQEKDWERFLENYNPALKNTGLDCLHRKALLNIGSRQQALANIVPLWKTGRPLPEACNTVISAWQESGGLTTALIWERLRLALGPGDKALIQQLILMLPSSLQDLAQQGVAARAEALSLATSGEPSAAKALANVPDSVTDQSVREWRIRSAIAQSQWSEVRQGIQALPEKERNEPVWRYWLARASQQLGSSNTANTLYRSLVKKPDYYGFLASARLKQPFVYRRTGEQASPQQVNQMAKRAGLKRAYEFHQLKMLPLARLEWNAAIRDMNTQQLRAAGQLALKWQWHDRAITTAVKAGLMDDITLRFPVAFRARVVTEAEKYNLDPSWIFGIMRQESAFMSDAKSSAGAMGLMQIMPETAKWLARKSKAALRDPSDAFHIEKNISLGARYLSDMLTSYRGNMILATAAYNGGPGRIKRWVAAHPTLIGDQWIETLPWMETRNYVKNVLAFTSIYDLHFGEKPNFDVCLEKVEL